MHAKYQLLLAAVIISLFTVIPETKTAAVSNTSDHGRLRFLEISQPKPEAQQSLAKSLLHIDLNSCTCLNHAEECEIAISKSTILELDCPPEKFFCCREDITNNRPSSPIATPDDTVTTHALTSSDDPNVKIRLLHDLNDPSEEEILPGGDNPWETRAFPSSSSTKLNNLSTTQKKKCFCKSRRTCPEKYIDYSFGFHCTYDKVHCCGPEEIENLDDPPQPTDTDSATGPLPTNKTAASTDYYEEEPTAMEEEEEEVKCYCLPQADLKDCKGDENSEPATEENLVWRRRDTLCPGETVQCCRRQLSIILDKLGEQQDGSNYNDGVVDSQTLTSNDSDSTTAMGQGGFRQPIQLPELKIPLADNDFTRDEGEEVNSYLQTSTLSPPQLPTYYNYQPPKYYSGYYYPGHHIPQVFNPPTATTQKYNDGYVRYPWSRDPSPYPESVQGGDPGGHRGINQPFPIEQHPRSSPNTSLLDKIASILG